MRLLSVSVLIVGVFYTNAKRAGVTPCSGEVYPNSYTVGSTTSGTTNRAYIVEDKNFQFQCCGVVSSLNYNLAGGGTLVLQIWRQKDATDYELISSQTVTQASGSVIPEHERVSFREGDYLGWYTDSEVTYSVGTVYGNRFASKGSVDSLTVNPSSYLTYAWGAQDADVDRLYDIQAVTAASEPPYFTNLPNTVVMKQVDVLISAVDVITLTVTDRNPDDANGLTVRMNPDWIDIFSFDASTMKVTTNSRLRKELSPYLPVFRVEENHCGLSTTATLTVSVVNSAPKITSLPAYADVHEDDVDQKLLHTITLSDEENEAIWCKGNWTIGQEITGRTPFIVKMISTTAGSSSAGIYLIEWPKLDYSSSAQYTLTVLCRDTADNEVSGTFTVNIVENQKPIFTNLDNSVEIDATKVRTGTTIFIVSSIDTDGDQVTYTSTCTPAATCPVTIFNSGHVMLTEELLFHTGANVYTLQVTPSDHRASNDPRTLTIFIINISNAPVLTNVNGASVNVPENTATGTSIFQASATDADSGDKLEFSMTISPTIGGQLFSINSTSGVISTHSSNEINFESLGASTTFSMSVMVHDGKQLIKDTLTIQVDDVNEAPIFVQPAFGASAMEGPTGTTLNTAVNLLNMVIDPDDISWTFSLNCGTTYNAYFSMDQNTGVVTFAQDYDLDATSMPQTHFCSVIAEDSVTNNATATYFISISYDNDNSPVFNPASYSVTVGADSVLGTSVLKVTATDADAGTDGEFEYTLDQSSLSGTYFVVGSTGIISVDSSLTSFASGGSATITVTATDTGSLAATANIDITFTETAVTTTTTTESNRDFKFIDDARNVSWVSPAVITMVIALGVVIYMVIQCIQARRGPISLLTLNFKLPTLIRPRLTRERDENNRSMPFAKQRPPVIRHINAKDLRVAPLSRPEPKPVPKAEPKPNTAVSKTSVNTDKSDKIKDEIKERVGISVSDKANKNEKLSISDVKDDEAWMDRNPSQGSKSVAPVTIVAHPKSTEKEYLNPLAGHKTPKSNATGVFSRKSASPSPSVTLSQAAPDTIRVTPSPLSWNNTGEDDDVSLPDSLRAVSPSQE